MGEPPLLLVYPGCMVGVTAILSGYLLNQFLPQYLQWVHQQSRLSWSSFAWALRLAWPTSRSRGVTGTTGVNVLINIVQITALLVFSVMAISYRVHHGEGSRAFQLVNGIPVDYNVMQGAGAGEWQAQNWTPPVSRSRAPKMDE